MSVLYIMPMAKEEKVVQMPSYSSLAATLRTQHWRKQKGLWRRVHSCASEDAFRAEEFEGLDLDGVGCEVEVTRQDDVGDLQRGVRWRGSRWTEGEPWGEVGVVSVRQG